MHEQLEAGDGDAERSEAVVIAVEESENAGDDHLKASCNLPALILLVSSAKGHHGLWQQQNLQREKGCRQRRTAGSEFD